MNLVVGCSTPDVHRAERLFAVALVSIAHQQPVTRLLDQFVEPQRIARGLDADHRRSGELRVKRAGRRGCGRGCVGGSLRRPYSSSRRSGYGHVSQLRCNTAMRAACSSRSRTVQGESTNSRPRRRASHDISCKIIGLKAPPNSVLKSSKSQ